MSGYPSDPARPRAIVTDIEGTTSSISFVHETLFPYAARHLRDYVRAHPDTVRPHLDEVRALEQAKWMDDAACVDVLLRWIREDRKITPLKALQGMIWAQGYARGELTGHIYDDAAEALRRWHGAGHVLAVYSSGSVPAQKLIYGHSNAGDLTGLFSGWFDTTTGPKLAAASYGAIAQALGRAPQDVLFLSDHPGEIAAAREAGLAVQLVDRAEGGPGAGAVASFADIDPEAGR
jgi:enolase-phosphatase E1